jgi:uncharacterized membrane protein YdbT with pleckstrin-like domain
MKEPKNLIEAPHLGEYEIEFRSSTLAFMLKSGWGWLLIAVTVFTFGYAALLTLPILACIALRNMTAKYWLEGERLFMRRGIFFRSEEEIELYRIKDVKANFSIIQQMFGNGDLAIVSTDTADIGTSKRAYFVIRNVVDARSIRETLRNRVEAVRKKRGVREFDIN